ncbi:MAG: amidohydrolase family protein [Gemmatimonadetes bacterium]|nr:amidohydrolase family protein [Gemmatimonadota bacterium]
MSSPGRLRPLPLGVCGALLATLPAAAQEIVLPDESQVVAIEAGRLIDGRSGDVQEDVTILVRGARIEAVGAGIDVPGDATVLDLSDHTVMPGFMDMHTHITSDPSGGDSDGSLRQWPGYGAVVGAKNARKTLLAGFTTIRNVGAYGFEDIGLRDAINEGLVPGPRIFSAAHGLGITGGHCDTNGYRPGLLDEPGVGEGKANDAAGFRDAVNYQIKYGADVIKFCATGGVLSAGTAVGVQQLTEEDMRALVETAHFAQRPVAAHAHGNAGIKAAVRSGVDSIEHGSEIDDETVALMVEHGTYHVPTMMAFEAVVEGARNGFLTPHSAAKALEIAPRFEASIRRSIAGGVKIAFGTDAGVFPHGENAGEFALLVRAGMTPMNAILSATREAATLMRRESDLGAVAPGFLADIVAVRGDPLERIELLESIDFVMKDGVVYKLDGREAIGGAERLAS